MRVDLSFIFVEDSLEDLLVEHMGALGLGVEKVDIEGDLYNVEEGDEAEDEVNEALEDIDETEDDPVGEPEFVIFLGVLGLNGLETHVGGVEESDEETNPDGAVFQKDQKSNDQTKGKTDVSGLDWESFSVLLESLILVKLVKAELSANLVNNFHYFDGIEEFRLLAFFCFVLN